MFDLIVKGARVVDGTGREPFSADVAVRDGRIVEIGRVNSGANEVIDADGAIVTPGFVDVHTHYDGQATWDGELEPSASNGVTTVVMGNCGVGFAPVRRDGMDELIDMMEGVEDIPGSALSVGMPWGKWESFPEYLDLLEERHFAVDVASQIAHGPLRFYVMGERGALNEDATEEDLVQMGELVRQAMAAGAVGFTTSRTIGHRSRSGRPVPGTFAPAEELLAIAASMRGVGHGVFEAIAAGTIGSLERLGGERSKLAEELPLLEAVQRECELPLTFTLAQLFEDPEHWRLVLDEVQRANAAGSNLRPQVIPRSVTIMTSLDTYHLFMGRPTYEKIKDLPLGEQVHEMRRPEIKAAILAERAVAEGPKDFTELIVQLYAVALPVTFSLRAPINYEPTFEDSVAARAGAMGVDPVAYMYDLLLEDDGRAFYAVFGSNFVGGSLEVCRDMMLNEHTVTGLSDAGAHVNLISDCSVTTFHLTHWARDRSRGATIPLEQLVAKMTSANADLYGFRDRGRLEPGRRADLNVIDFDALTINAPVVRHDLPSGASRILQSATGYLATTVHGVVTRRHDENTGQRPGRLVRGGRTTLEA